MMVKKSRTEIAICCGGGAEVVDVAASGGAVLGAGDPEKTEGSGSDGIGARGGGADTEGARA